jgi:hypothetical protein
MLTFTGQKSSIISAGVVLNISDNAYAVGCGDPTALKEVK